MEQEEKEMRYEEKIALVPVWKKCMLSLEEAVAFTGIGRDRLLELSDQDNCDFVIWSGRKRLFKRKRLEEFIEQGICSESTRSSASATPASISL